ncbi:MAG: hypothetical protein P8X67_19570 [Syntrophobacterales bacterium]
MSRGKKLRGTKIGFSRDGKGKKETKTVCGAAGVKDVPTQRLFNKGEGHPVYPRIDALHECADSFF